MSGTATFGTDYALGGTAGQFVIAPGASTATVVLNALGDNVSPEANKTAIMTLTAGSGYKLKKAKKGATPPTVTIVNVSPPSAPIATAASSVTTNSFAANWNTVGNATGYRVDVATTNSFSSYVAGLEDLDVGNVLSKNVSGLVASTPYYYRVRAYNGGGTSASSNIISATTSSTPIITTVAGSGRQLLGLGSDATQVNLGDLGGLARDSGGNLYVSDQSVNGVVKITSGGVATLVAGNGVQGFSGDNGPATQASLNGPGSLLFDAADNLYISDENNNRVRRVTPSGTITTFAGGGPDVNQPPAEGILATNTFVSPTGLAIDSAENVYVSDANHKIVRKIRSDNTVITVIGNGIQGFSGDGGLATAAAINSPTGLAVDSAGNIYMADAGVARIRKVTTDGIIHTIAGTGQTGLNGDGGPAVNATIDQPRDLFVDSAGDLYIAISANNVIRKISAADGIINTVVGNGAYGFSGDGGPAVNATLKQAVSVVLDNAHNIYVSDHLNNRIRKVDSLGAINTIAGNGAGNSFGDGGPAVSAGLNQPLTPAFDGSGNMYIADTNNNKVRKVKPDGTISTIAGNGISDFSGDGGPAVDASLSEPEGVAADSAGNVYVADFRNARVRRVDLNGIITTYAGNGQHGCCGFAAIGDGGQAVDAVLGEGMGSIALDGQGNLFIADGQNYRIRKVDTNGIITTVAGNGQNAFNGDGGPATSASFRPWAVAVDGNGNIYISEEGDGHHYIRKVNSGGIISTVAGDGTPGSDDEFPPGTLATSVGSENPGGVAVAADGSFYFTGSGQVRRVATDGTISRVVKSRNGDQHGGFAGDGGPAIDGLMNLNRPGAVAMDAAGDLYIADPGNHRIRKVWLHGDPTPTPSPTP